MLAVVCALVAVLGQAVLPPDDAGAPSAPVQTEAEQEPEPRATEVESPAVVAPSEQTPPLAPHEARTPASGSSATLAARDEQKSSGDGTQLRARQVQCGDTMSCFRVGRTTVTAFFIEIEDARISYKPAVSARTGLNGGWGVGFKFGLELWDWIPLQFGVRHASPNDSRPFSQSVMNCMQELGGAPVCDGNWHDVTSSAGAVYVSVETGIEPNIRIARGLALSPGLLLGHAATPSDFERSVSNCPDCSVEPLNVSGSGAYLAPSLRMTWGVLGLALRYERYLQGDLRDAIAIGFDLGLRYKSVFSALPGEK